ncbi:brachyurin-like isoform X2 [Neocloeon triangulifer]|uniref:brachyurin-like isoform X2 n=1 Tax=Neocloeon triangulifer TaxID=2078957 RepID=UPI00286F6F3F|nr:brachyurin-like isoform X2 [Neocloeon triangulifer]
MNALPILLALLSFSVTGECQEENFKFKNLGIKNRTVTSKEWLKYKKDPSNWKPKVDYVYHKSTKPQDQSAGISYDVGISMQITGGMRARQKMFPWQILLLATEGWLCGGSLISSEWVMTAAHCVDGVVIYAGGIDQKNKQEKNEQRYSSATLIKHENYDANLTQNDIALVKVLFTLDKFVNLIRLPKYSDATNAFDNKKVLLAGYGQTADVGASSRYMMYNFMKTITNTECALLYAPEYVTSSIICTGPDKKKSACYGDSGGALNVQEKDKKYTAIGIVSSGPDLCINFISTYTRVTSFLGWISEKTGIQILA